MVAWLVSGTSAAASGAAEFGGDAAAGADLVGSLKPVPFWTAVHGYDGLLKRLGAPHPTVLAAPYDFRVGVVAAAEHVDRMVRHRLDELWPGGDHTGRVVVAHSMGGLVARYWLGVGGATDCFTALITLGTPHWGAPKALDVLANGIPVRGMHALPRLRDVLRGWPSMVDRGLRTAAGPRRVRADRVPVPR